MGWLETLGMAAVNPTALIGSGAAMGGQIMANEANAKQAAKNRDFQRDMSSTAHQREVIDLRAAGLNPILSGTGGSGASTPSGATAQMQDVVGPAISSALSIMKTMAETQKTISETMPIKLNQQKLTNEIESIAQSGNLSQSSSLNQFEQSEYWREYTTLVKQLPVTESLKQKMLGLDISSSTEVLKQLKNEGAISETKFGQFLTLVRKTGESVSPYADFVRTFIFGKNSAKSLPQHGPRLNR